MVESRCDRGAVLGWDFINYVSENKRKCTLGSWSGKFVENVVLNCCAPSDVLLGIGDGPVFGWFLMTYLYPVYVSDSGG